MERKQQQGFFSALKEEVVRGLSPARSRGRGSSRSVSPMAALLRRGSSGRKQQQQQHQHQGKKDGELLAVGSRAMRVTAGEALAPLMEGPPDNDGRSRKDGWGQWVKGQLARSSTHHPVAGSSDNSALCRRSDLRLLLGVMGAPLAPIHVSLADPIPHLSIKDTPIETSSAQYILQQYTAASGGLKVQSTIRNAYAMGKVRMFASEFETANKVVSRNGAKAAELGGFVLWQMNPDMWYVELSVGVGKVHAGCNGKLVWRHTPWLGAHAAKGPVRPLRRTLQGIDPRTTACMFANARCSGEKKIHGEDCFTLKLCADPLTLKSRSEGPAEIIRHVLFGHFSQKTGLLVHMEDSHLTRIQPDCGGDAVYWETNISSFLDDYRPVEGMMISHSGRSVVTLHRFGNISMSRTKTRMEETWTIEEVAFNVPGLSVDCFIPPADVRLGSVSEDCELPQSDKGKATVGAHRAKVVALGGDQHDIQTMLSRRQ